MHHIPARLGIKKHMQSTGSLLSKTYVRVEKLKQREEKHAGLFLRSSYVVDTFLQDWNITTTLSDAYDAALTVKDTVDTTFQAGLHTRKIVKHKHKMALMKVLYIVYKIVVYKCLLLGIVNKNDHVVRMLLDYIHMVFDAIIR